MRKVRYEPVNKYIQCYCEKRQVILLGGGIIIYVHILGVILSLFLFIFTLSIMLAKSSVGPSSGYILLGLLPFYVLLLRWNYDYCVGVMKKAGHTASCCKSVALRAMWYQARGSNIRVDVDPREVDPQGDYGTPVMGLWLMAFMVNTVFLVSYSNEGATSVLYPILFIFAIAASAGLLARIKNMTRGLFVMCVLNIVTSGLLLQLYGLSLIAKFA